MHIACVCVCACTSLYHVLCPAGEKLGEVRAEYSGFVVGWSGGISFQAGKSIGSCGLPDGLPMVVDYDDALAGKL